MRTVSFDLQFVRRCKVHFKKLICKRALRLLEFRSKVLFMEVNIDSSRLASFGFKRKD